jgi:ABC-type sugar transport system ATPase subunit
VRRAGKLDSVAGSPMTAAEPTGEYVLEAVNIWKRYGGTQAVAGVSLRLRRGEVVALVGENGAGKSTLLRIISGAVAPDRGVLRVGGREVKAGDPLASARHGVATVYQELNLLTSLSVAENLYLGDYPTRFGLVRWERLRREARAVMDRLGIDLAADARVGDLPLAERYLLELARAVRREPPVLILDEPTAALDRNDVGRMLRLVDRLRMGGTAVVFVSHRLDEVMAAAQRYLVMKDGETVGEGDLAATSQSSLVSMMAGRGLAAGDHVSAPAGARPEDTAARTKGDEAIRGEGLWSEGFRDVSFAARAGEVVGLAGLRGSGRTELCRALAGAQSVTRGHIFIAGRRVRALSPFQALRAGVGYVPAERKTEGLLLDLSVAENISLTALAKDGPRLVRPKNQVRRARQLASLLAIKLPADGLKADARMLSGGNQQKIVLAKWLAADVSVLVVDEPTRGVDVVAKGQIYELIRKLADGGKCVIVSSSELSELTQLCERIVVLHRGRVTGELRGPDYDEEQILNFAFGAAPGADQGGDSDEA